MSYSKHRVFNILIKLAVGFLVTVSLVSCSRPGTVKVIIINETGHNDVYVVANKWNAHLHHAETLAFETSITTDVYLTATAVEKDATGVVTWGYKYKGMIFQGWDPQSFFSDFEEEKVVFRLTNVINQYYQ